jgi:amidase
MSTSGISRRELLRNGAALAAAAATVARPLAAIAKAAERAMPFDEYVNLDATALAQLVATGEASALELIEAAIARAEVVNPKLNAIVIEHFDRARKAAREGLPDGPLRGVPFLLKDLHLQLAGTVTSHGSRAFSDAVAKLDSTAVERYRAAGLNIFGKTASPEFGNTATTESELWGDTRNPWNLAYSPGGSSGGSAAAVAAGILPAANASDGGGSIRIPASNCGLFGLKPTRARIPLGPNRFEGANGLSVLHAVTRSVRDSAMLLDITRGAAHYDPYAAPPVARPYVEELERGPGKLRIGWIEETITRTPVHPECRLAAANAVKLCETLGHSIEKTRFPVDPRSYYDAIGINSAVLTTLSIREREKAIGRAIREDELEPMNYAKLAQADKLSAVDLARARNTFHQVGAAMADLMQRFDILLTPTQAAPPPKIGVLSLSNPDEQAFMKAAIDASVFTQIYNVSGQPAMSVPLHWTPEGLPVGVQFAARFGGEDVLFRLGAQLEIAQPWGGRRAAI